jgi:hypothetical protein
MTSFLTGSAGGEKGGYVIFQYGLVIQDAQGRIARFKRDADDKGHGVRNLEGSSILISGSHMMVPNEAIQSIVVDKLSLGNKETIRTIECLGFAYNRQPQRDKVARADYLFALFRIVLDGIRLNGLVQENPDSFHWWSDPSEMTLDSVDGLIDQALLKNSLLCRVPTPVFAVEIGVSFHPECVLVDDHGSSMTAEPFETKPSRTVFISHDAGAQLKAFLLRDVLIKRSRQRLYPFLDLHFLERSQDGFWHFIESHIEQSDVFLLLVTEKTALSHGVLRELEYRAALPNPPRLVVVQVDGTREDIPPQAAGINLINYVSREYRLWHQELEGLVTNLCGCPFRPESLHAKSPLLE